MAGSDKRSSGLQRSVAASHADSDQTDPNARIDSGADDERTVAGDLSLSELGLDDDLLVTPEGDKTQVYNAASAAAAGASEYKLMVLAGPKAGADFPLAETVMTLGRAPDNHVTIPDVSVSRKHVRFTRLGEEGFTVEDLGSGNGTKVNGDVIQGPVHLRHGDEVTMGDTTVQLVEVGVPVVKKKGAVKPPPEAAATRMVPPDEARKIQAAVKALQPKPASNGAKPAPAAPAGGLSPEKKKLYVGLFAAIIVGFVILAMLKGGGEGEESPQEAAVDVSAEVDEAMKLAGQGKWTEAESRLKGLLEQSDNDPDVKTKYEKVKTNVQAQKQVSQAKRALENEDYAQARETLALVSKKTVFFDEARKLAEQVDAAVAQAASDAKTALSAGDKERAASLADRVLAADAQNTLALSVRQELEKKAGRKGAGDAGAGARARKGADAAKEATDEAEAAPARGGGSSALGLYLAGDLAGALRAADQGGDPILQRLRAFDQAFRDGAAKANANKSAEAVKALEAARKLDHEISRGKPSKPGAEVGKALGNQEYMLGLDSKGDEQLARASAHFSAAVEADPSNDLYRKALDKTNSKVLEVYTQAYVARSTDPDSARRLFRIACDALPASHEKHERACTFYKSLGGK